MMEKISEGREDRVSIGTTSRGIGPCYEDKIARRGIRMADLLDPDFFRTVSIADGRKAVDRRRAFSIDEPCELPDILDAYQAFAEHIRPMVCDTAASTEQHDPRRQEPFCLKARRAPCSISITERIRS